MSKLGSVLRAARVSRKMSMQELAKACRIDASYVCRIENNDPTRQPSAQLLERFAEALELDRDSVFALAGRIPDDLTKWIIRSPGMLSRLRREMSA